MNLKSVVMVSALVGLALGVGMPVRAGAKKAGRPYKCGEKLTRVIKLYDRGKYNRAQSILSETKFECSGHQAMDSIIYYLGMTYLRGKRPRDARVEFQELIRDFPRSAFHEEAAFRIGQCSMMASESYERDQTETRDAIREFNDFLVANPQSPFADSAEVYLKQCREKLAKKKFMNARFYEKIDQHEAAVIYYRSLLEEFPNTSFVPEAKLNMARDLLRLERLSEAGELVDEILAKEGNDEIRERAQNLRDRIRHME